MREREQGRNVRQKKNATWRARITRGMKADGSPRAISNPLKTKDDAKQWLLDKSVKFGGRHDMDAGVTPGAVWKLYESQTRASAVGESRRTTVWWFTCGTNWYTPEGTTGPLLGSFPLDIHVTAGRLPCEYGEGV